MNEAVAIEKPDLLNKNTNSDNHTSGDHGKNMKPIKCPHCFRMIKNHEEILYKVYNKIDKPFILGTDRTIHMVAKEDAETEIVTLKEAPGGWTYVPVMKDGTTPYTYSRMCPYCNGEFPLEFGKYPVKTLSLIGTSGSGKTVYISNILNATRNSISSPLSNYKISAVCESYNETVKKFVEINPTKIVKVIYDEARGCWKKTDVVNSAEKDDYVIVEYPESTHIDRTRESLPPIIIKLHNQAYNTGMHLVIYDIAGESFNRTEVIHKSQNLYNSDAAICLISPEEMKLMLGNGIKFSEGEGITENGSSVVEKKEIVIPPENNFSFADTIGNMCQAALERQVTVGEDAKDFKKLPFAFVLSKSDLYKGAVYGNNTAITEKSPLLRTIDYGRTGNKDKSLYIESGRTEHVKDIKKILTARDTGILSILNFFTRKEFFALSAFPANKMLRYIGSGKVLNEAENDLEANLIYKCEALLDISDFYPLRTEESLGWIFYEWGWIGCDNHPIKSIINSLRMKLDNSDGFIAKLLRKLMC